MNRSSGSGLPRLLTLGSVILLSPALRIFPQQSAELAGRAAWLTPLCALPVVLIYMYMLSRLMERRQDGEGLPELILRVFGHIRGRVILCLLALWLGGYAAFALRAGADRLIVTIYPNSSPAPFCVVTGLLALCAALSDPRSLAKTARILRPVIFGALVILLLRALFSVDIGSLLPVGAGDTVPILRGAAVSVDIISGAALALCFMLDCEARRGREFGRLALWACLNTALLTLLSAALVGSFGAPLCARLSRPFFVLVRNMVFFRTVERIEALVVMLWIFPDFLLVSLFLRACSHCVRLVLGCDVRYKKEKPLDFSSGRWVIWLSAAAVITLSLVLAPDAVTLDKLSRAVVPAINLAIAFGLVPLTLFAARGADGA